MSTQDDSRDTVQVGREVYEAGDTKSVTPSVVDEIAARSQSARLELGSGRVITATPNAEGDHIAITSPEGTLELAITMTQEGPVLRMRAVQLDLAADAVNVDCDTFEVNARKGIAHSTDGALEERVAGDRHSRVGGDATTLARTARVEASRGDVELVANDDVRLLGERIKLNC